MRLALLGLLVYAAAAWATEIRLTTGQVFSNATILSRDDVSLQIRVPYGVVTLPLVNVAAIDWVKFARPVRLEPAPGPVLAEPPPPDPGPPPYVHSWKMEIFLGSLLLVGCVWVAMLLWVQRDVRGTPPEIRRANADVLLLPGLGFGWYLISRARRPRRAIEPHSLTGRVAGLLPDEAPKKRSLFGGRAKISPGYSRAGVELEFLDSNRNPITVKRDSPEMSGIEAARDVLEQALAQRASDVHVEPTDHGCRVRFRIDGIMQERLTFDRTDGLHVSAALKALAQIDVAEKRKSQDGRFRVRTKTSEVDFRVATTNSVHGEKLVLRILDRQSGLLALSDLGMPKPMMDRFDRAIHSRNGLILATGPTGSGKTSTLYAALSRLDSQKLNIMTIEDPVEYELTGSTQIPVNPKAGVTYESGLRSILRQDPDVIFVGEMRDAEAAKIALRAVLTGHLVFSSLHADNALATVLRLEEMGVERHQISTALLMIVTQRLVRMLCKRCREATISTGGELKELGLVLPAGKTIYKPGGCDVCDMTGFQGRTGIFELLVLNDAFRKAIYTGTDQPRLLELAREQGYRPYREDGVDKILTGVTTAEEVLQAS